MMGWLAQPHKSTVAARAQVVTSLLHAASATPPCSRIHPSVHATQPIAAGLCPAAARRQVCTDSLSACDRAMAAAGVKLVDRQLACMPVTSPEGAAPSHSKTAERQRGGGAAKDPQRHALARPAWYRTSPPRATRHALSPPHTHTPQPRACRPALPGRHGRGRQLCLLQSDPHRAPRACRLWQGALGASAQQNGARAYMGIWQGGDGGGWEGSTPLPPARRVVRSAASCAGPAT